MTRPDALFYASDTMTLGGLRAPRDGGISVPDDSFVAGDGDIAFAEVFSPSLTTVRVRNDLLGTSAGRPLETTMADPSVRPPDVNIDVTIVVRESTRA